MARRVYFAFHFERDIWRANIVRNCNVVLGRDEAGFFDHSEYEEAKRKSAEAIRRLIREKISGTSVTVVLVGQETWLREWVQFEIEESLKNNNGLVGVHIHLIPDAQRDISLPGYPPAVPPNTPFPSMTWQPRSHNASVARLKAMIEAAGRRADVQRIAMVRRALGPWPRM
jgi:hypothetical protein